MEERTIISWNQAANKEENLGNMKEGNKKETKENMSKK